MLEIFRNAWKIKDLRRKILVTLLLLLVYRVGAVIPTPNLNPEVISSAMSGGVWAMMDLFNGGSLSKLTIFATGITPYITSSIVMQLLAMAIPALERLQKEGEEGRKKITQITRYVAIALAFAQSMFMMITFGRQGVLINNAWYMYALIAIIHAAGTAFAMWIGEKITEGGIGNGISLLIFVNIISRLPGDIFVGIKSIAEGNASAWGIPIIAVGVLAIVAAVVFINLGERRIPVQYAKRVVGRKMYGGQSTYIPMRVNNSGVLPLIFAMTFANLPNMIFGYFPEAKFAQGYLRFMRMGGAPYAILTALLILAFAYFYSTVTFNPQDIAKNVQQYGGFIPGIRPGRPTAMHLARISSRITLFSALFLALLAVIPMMIFAATGSQSPLQATSILIMVSVALETSKQLESQMMMRHYKGFLN